MSECICRHLTIKVGWIAWIAYRALDWEPRVQFPVLAKTLVFHNTLVSFPMLNKGSPPIELPSLWGTRSKR